MRRKLIYIMDAQCGWCYGNSENIQTIYDEFKDEFDFELLSGGMWVGEHAPHSGTQISQYIGTHIPRLTAFTGVVITDAFKTLISESDYVLSSLEPSAALVWAKHQDNARAFHFAKAVQQALFIKGQQLDRLETYLPLLEEFGFDKERFQQEWLSDTNLEQTWAEFGKVGNLATGFPTLVLEQNGALSLLAEGYFNLNDMRNHLMALLNSAG